MPLGWHVLSISSHVTKAVSFLLSHLQSSVTELTSIGALILAQLSKTCVDMRNVKYLAHNLSAYVNVMASTLWRQGDFMSGRQRISDAHVAYFIHACF